VRPRPSAVPQDGGILAPGLLQGISQDRHVLETPLFALKPTAPTTHPRSPRPEQGRVLPGRRGGPTAATRPVQSGQAAGDLRGAARGYARPSSLVSSAPLLRRGCLDQHSCLRLQRRQVRTTHSMPSMNSRCRSQECNWQGTATLAECVFMVCSASRCVGHRGLPAPGQALAAGPRSGRGVPGGAGGDVGGKRGGRERIGRISARSSEQESGTRPRG